MSDIIVVPPEAPAAPGKSNLLHLVEDTLSVIAFSLMTVLPVVDHFFKAMSRYETGPRKQQFMNVRESLRDPKFRQSIEDDQNLNYMFRNTITLTQMEGSHQTNVIPATAESGVTVPSN